MTRHPQESETDTTRIIEGPEEEEEKSTLRVH